MAEIGVLPGQGAPWGGIVKTATPFTDQVTASLLAQQADRRKYQQETTLKADELMNKELANVRSVDMSQVIDNYGKWKNISMQMLSPKVQADPRLYNQLQIQKNAALGQTMASINQSAQLNQQMKELVAERKTKPNLYSDDFGDRVAAFNMTPMGQIRTHPKYGDLTNPDSFRHMGSQTDFGKMETAAAGKFAPMAGAEKREQLNNLQTRITPTEFGSTPAQFFENLRGQFAQHIPGRDAAAAMDGISEQQRAAVDQQFAAISPEKWLAMTGTAKPQVITPTDPNNAAEQYAAYRAKVYAINAAPRAGTAQTVTNQEMKMQEQFGQQRAMEVLKEANRETRDKKRLALQHEYKQLSTAEQSQIANKTFQDLIDQGVSGGLVPTKTTQGKTINEYDLGQYAALNKDFQVQVIDDKGKPQMISPSTFRLSEDKKTVRPIFLQSGEEVGPGQFKAIYRDISKPIPVSVFKALVSKELFGTREAAKESGSPATTTKTGASGVQWQ